MTRETIGGNPINPAGTSNTEVETPESLNLEFQTGVAADTLVFGSIRYARYSDTIVSPDVFNAQTNGLSLTNIEDSTDYEMASVVASMTNGLFDRTWIPACER